MKVYVVFGVYDGVPTDLRVFSDRLAAERYGRELAQGYDVLEKPWDWGPEDGAWVPTEGATRYWLHHWYNDERDVVVEECQVQEAPVLRESAVNR